MGKPNRILLALLFTNGILVWGLALINSSISTYGIFLYLPGLLIIPALYFLDPVRAIPCLFLSGLVFDNSFETTFGFHAFSLSLAYLTCREIFRFGKKHYSLGPLSLQMIANLAIGTVWGIFVSIHSSELGTWGLSRMLLDLMLSCLFMYPLGIWYPQLCMASLEMIGANPLPTESPVK